MQAFFPRRTRKQLKNKFYRYLPYLHYLSIFREESRHPELIKATLNSLIPLDLAPFEVHLGHILPEDANQNSYPTQELPAIEPIFGVDVSSLADNSVSYAPPPSIDDSELVDV